MNHSNIYLIFDYSGARKAFRKIMQHKRNWFACIRVMYHFEKLSRYAKQNICLNKIRHFAKYLAKSS